MARYKPSIFKPTAFVLCNYFWGRALNNKNFSKKSSGAMRRKEFKFVRRHKTWIHKAAHVPEHVNMCQSILNIDFIQPVHSPITVVGRRWIYFWGTSWLVSMSDLGSDKRTLNFTRKDNQAWVFPVVGVNTGNPSICKKRQEAQGDYWASTGPAGAEWELVVGIQKSSSNAFVEYDFINTNSNLGNDFF